MLWVCRSKTASRPTSSPTTLGGSASCTPRSASFDWSETTERRPQTVSARCATRRLTMPTSSPARSTASTPRRKGKAVAPSMAAWERVLDRRRRRLKDSPSRSAVFGRAGLRNSKMLWLRRQPDLRVSVLVALSLALEMSPTQFLKAMLREESHPPQPPAPPPPRPPHVSITSRSEVQKRRRLKEARAIVGSIPS